MPGPTQPYQYKPDDDPIKLANQYGVSVQEIINANPGGYPFTAGQSIRIPQSRDAYLAQIEANRRAQRQAIGGALGGVASAVRNVFATDTPYMGYGPNAPRGQQQRYPLYQYNVAPPNISPQYPLYSGNTVPAMGAYPMYAAGVYGMQEAQAAQINAMRGRGTNRGADIRPPANVPFSGAGVPPVGYGPPALPAPVLSSQYGTDDSWATGTPSTTYADSITNRQQQAVRAETDFQNTQAARYNAEHNIPFLNQLRWDPQRRRYISVGRWLNQNRRGGRGRGGRKAPEQKQQEFTLTNSFIDFNASSG